MSFNHNHRHGNPQNGETWTWKTPKKTDGLFPLAHGGCSFPSDCFYDSACWKMTHNHYLAKWPRLLLAFMVPTTWEVQKIQSQFVVFVGVYLQMHTEDVHERWLDETKSLIEPASCFLDFHLHLGFWLGCPCFFKQFCIHYSLPLFHPKNRLFGADLGVLHHGFIVTRAR